MSVTQPGSGDLAEEFDAHRRYLSTVAYRMLGSHADAEDAVQEA
ncbi:sigma factor, partial [Pseudactinotalea sp.]